MIRHLALVPVLCLLAFASCKKSTDSSPAPKPIDTTHVDTTHHDTVTVAPSTGFAKGADVSWVTEMEDAGRTFSNAGGAQQDLFQILKGYQINAIRLRAWVNPVEGYNGTPDLLAKAKRAKAAGMRILIDFHYSDTWADPANQAKPAAWASLSTSALKGAMYAYTRHVLDTLRQAGIQPSWVQIGNETSNGMLFPIGKASTRMQDFAQMIDTGYAAVKSIDTSIVVIVHSANGQDNSLFRWLFAGLDQYHARYDAIGMSLYPDQTNWQAYADQATANANDMIATYGKSIVICELGMPTDQTAAGQQFVSTMISRIKALPNGKGLGAFYWEPEAYGWQNYGYSAWQSNGQPSATMNGFLE